MRHGPYIVIEGADGTGKTTLARTLEEYGATYIHCGPPDQEPLYFYLKALRQHEGLVVADRLHIGSQVYGRVFRNGADLDDFSFWLIEGFLTARGAILVHATVSDNVQHVNLSRGPDDEDAVIYEDPLKRDEVKRLFSEEVARSCLPTVTYDYTKDRGNLLRELILTSQRLPYFEAAVLGNTVSPKFVFVGDRPTWYDRNLRRGTAVAERFARRFDSGVCWDSLSGRYLFETFRVADLSLRDYCTFNSVQGDGRTLQNLIDEDSRWFDHVLSSGGEFVALGKLASRELDKVLLPHRLVPHPQYVKRFFYKHKNRYADLLIGKQEYNPEEWKP